MAGAPVPVGIDSFLIAIATSAIMLRFISRTLSGAGFWWDDWLALAAWPFSIATSASFLIAGFRGFGRHGGDPTFFLHALYYDELCYVTGSALTKISVLCFYRRIFTVERTMRRVIWGIGALILGWWLSFTISGILNCVPIHAYWNPLIKAKCVNKYSFYIGSAVPNILFDFAILFLPLHPLWKLNMKRVQKIALVAVFVLGYMNPIISIIRIVSLIQLNNKKVVDVTWDFVGPVLWSGAEIAVAIVSCSIPSLTYLFRRVIERSSKKPSARPSQSSRRGYGRFPGGVEKREKIRNPQSTVTQNSMIDNAGLASFSVNASKDARDQELAVWHGGPSAANVIPVDGIAVERDFQVAYDRIDPV